MFERILNTLLWFKYSYKKLAGSLCKFPLLVKEKLPRQVAKASCQGKVCILSSWKFIVIIRCAFIKMIAFVIHVPQVLQIWPWREILFPRAYICLNLTLSHWNFVFERYATVFIVHFYHVFNHNPTTKFFKTNDRNTGATCKIYSKLTIKTRHDVVLVTLLLTLNRQIIP